MEKGDRPAAASLPTTVPGLKEVLKGSPERIAAERADAAKRDRGADGGMPEDHKLIAPLLAAHPDGNVTICLAGCSDKPAIVQVIPKRVVQLESAMVPTSGPISDDDDPSPMPTTGDIICIAGCEGQPGEVVHRNVRLSWLSGENSRHLQFALQAIADRLLRAGSEVRPLPQRNWMSAAARTHFAGGRLLALAPIGMRD